MSKFTKKVLKVVEKETKDNFLLDNYKANCELLLKSEMAIKFFETQEGLELYGAESANREIMKAKEVIRVKEAEQKFLESLLTK